MHHGDDNVEPYNLDVQYDTDGVMSNADVHVHAIPTDSQPQQPVATLSSFTENKLQYIDQ